MSIQAQKIKIPEGIIKDELDVFEYHYTRNGGVKYAAPEGMHDDCVMALGLARKKHVELINNYSTDIDLPFYTGK